jgi:peptide/nickel transport system substrate-binding protein
MSKRLIALISILVVVVVVALLALGVYIEQGRLNRNVAAAQSADTNVNHVTVAYPSGPQGYYPTAPAEFVTDNYACYYYQGLTSFDKDMDIQPQLAESWENPNPNTWIFRLRKDVTFHNGQKMTADDVVASLNLALSYESQNPLLPTVTAAKKIDQYTVEIDTSTPTLILANLLAQVYILPQSLINSQDWSHPIGTGPYKFVSASSDGYTLNVTRYDNYYGPKPKVKNVTLEVIADDTQRLNALKEGKIDVSQEVTPTAAGTKDSKGNPIQFAIAQPIDADFLYFDDVHTTNQFITGTKTNPLLDVRVRQAMSLALNIPSFINSGDFSKNDPVATQVVPSTIFGYDPSLKPAEQNVAEAKSLMQQAGYQTGFTITLDTTDQQTNFHNLLTEQLAAIGITLKIHYWDPNDDNYYNQFMAGDSAMTIVSWITPSGDALEDYANIFGSGGQLNVYGFNDPQINTLLTDTQNATSLTQRKQDLYNLAEYVNQQYYVIPLLAEDNIYDYRTGLSIVPRADEDNLEAQTVGVPPASLKDYTFFGTIGHLFSKI